MKHGLVLFVLTLMLASASLNAMVPPVPGVSLFGPGGGYREGDYRVTVTPSNIVPNPNSPFRFPLDKGTIQKTPSAWHLPIWVRL